MSGFHRIIHALGFPLDFNGNLTRVLGEAIHVAKLGYGVDVLVADYVPKENLNRAIKNKVDVRLLKAMVPWRDIGWRVNNIVPLYIGAKRVVSACENGILHVSAPTPVTKPLTVTEVGKRSKTPIVLDLHDPWSAEPFSRRLFPMLQTRIMKRVIDSADHVLVAHTALLSLIKKVNPNKPVDLIPNGVDTELFKPKPPSLQAAEKIGLTGDESVVAFSGHIMEHKGLDTLIAAAQIVSKQHHNVKFLIIGDGPQRREVESMVNRMGLSDRFVFTGFVSQEEMQEYLLLADVCVAPYKQMAYFKISLPETPMKAVEYMALGKPVVMSRISDENVISWSGGGILTEPDNVKEFASKILVLIEDETLRKTMGEKGRKYVEANLSWTKIAKKLDEIYRSTG